MIEVPGKVVPLRTEGPKIDPIFYAMTIAQMHDEGRIKVAGDVVKLPVQPSTTAGPNKEGTQYITGAKSDKDVKPLPIPVIAGALGKS